VAHQAENSWRRSDWKTGTKQASGIEHAAILPMAGWVRRGKKNREKKSAIVAGGGKKAN